MYGRSLAVCPFTELGFLRISTHPKGPFRAPMADARALPADFLQKNRCEFVPADLPALKSTAGSSAVVTDSYLAKLADAHGLRLATLDTRIKHKAVMLIA
jgi:predicted nucleic acid-binding protein